MGLQHIAPIIAADNHRIIQHQTWGHLFPEQGKTFIGFIQLALTAYGDLIVLKDKSNVPASPWWYSSLMEYSNEFLMEKDNAGVVYEIQTHCKVIDTEDGNQEIEISNMGYKIVLK